MINHLTDVIVVELMLYYLPPLTPMERFSSPRDVHQLKDRLGAPPCKVRAETQSYPLVN